MYVVCHIYIHIIYPMRPYVRMYAKCSSVTYIALHTTHNHTPVKVMGVQIAVRIRRKGLDIRGPKCHRNCASLLSSSGSARHRTTAPGFALHTYIYIIMCVRVRVCACDVYDTIKHDSPAPGRTSRSHSPSLQSSQKRSQRGISSGSAVSVRSCQSSDHHQ